MSLLSLPENGLNIMLIFRFNININYSGYKKASYALTQLFYRNIFFNQISAERA